MPEHSKYNFFEEPITLYGKLIGSPITAIDWSNESDLLRLNVPEVYDPQHSGRYPWEKTEPLSIKKVIFHDPATVIYWSDGTKTVVKCKNEKFDKEKGLAMACMKKLLGNKGHYYEEVKKWTKEETNND